MSYTPKIYELVILESPFAHEQQFARNIAYTRACTRDCLLRGEAPFASHLIYTQTGILNDLDPLERSLGIDAGLNWGRAAQKSVVYTDFGISAGMREGVDRALQEGRAVEYRQLPEFQVWLDTYKASLNNTTVSLIPAQFIT